MQNESIKYGIFKKKHFLFSKAVASIKVWKGVKTEGELIISGTKGYVYVTAPWWKTEHFKIRRENPAKTNATFNNLTEKASDMN